MAGNRIIPLKTLCDELAKLKVCFYLRDDDNPEKPSLVASARDDRSLDDLLTPELSEGIKHWKPTIIKLLRNHEAYCLFRHPETLEGEPCRICHPEEVDAAPDEIVEGLREGVNQELVAQGKSPLQADLFSRPGRE